MLKYLQALILVSVLWACSSDNSLDSIRRQSDASLYNIDTDSDGLSDGKELELGSDPNLSDTDGDGLSDLQEVALGTHPADPTQSACADTSISTTVSPSMLDVIVAVDTSDTMSQEIQALEQHISAHFIETLKELGVDVRVILFASYEGGDYIHAPDPIESERFGYGICLQNSFQVGSSSCSQVDAWGGSGQAMSYRTGTYYDHDVSTMAYSDTGIKIENPNDIAPTFFHYNWHVGQANIWHSLLDRFNKPDMNGDHPKGYQGLLREEAFNVFLVLSDSDIQVPSPDNITEPSDKALILDGYIRDLSARHFGTQHHRNYMVHSLVGIAPYPNAPHQAYPPEDPIPAQRCASAQAAGWQHQALSRLSDGLRYPVCNTQSYEAIFAQAAIRSSQTHYQRCRYGVSLSAQFEPDWAYTTVTHRQVSDIGNPVRRVSQASSCTQGAQFFVTEQGVELCPELCQVIHNHPEDTIEVHVACEAILSP